MGETAPAEEVAAPLTPKAVGEAFARAFGGFSRRVTEFVNPGAAIEEDTEPAPAPSEAVDAESAPEASEAAMRHTTTAVEC